MQLIDMMLIAETTVRYRARVSSNQFPFVSLERNRPDL
jgi:hypothetical protein